MKNAKVISMKSKVIVKSDTSRKLTALDQIKQALKEIKNGAFSF